MLCLIAAEPGSAEVILENLQKVYPDWVFETCASSGDLQGYGGDRPDVLLLSRFMPGEEMLRHIPSMFPASHIVLLAGTLNESARAYIRRAKQRGLENIVTGKLPGDKPYTIFAALTQARQKFTEEEGLEWEESREDRENATESTVRTERANPYYRRRAGHFVIAAANKGGVGKTTVAVSLSLVMARAGIPTVLTDFDFGGPNVATFFEVKNKPGIEKLAGKKRPDMIQELLIEVSPGLFILPGPQDNTMPYFEPEQLTEIVNVLSEEYLVIGDTPPEFWTKPWLEGLFSRADLVLAVVDQSKFSEAETRDYAPKLVMMGVEPERIRVVCNRFNPKLHNVRKVESFFNSGFKKLKNPPQVIATVPEDWVSFVQKAYQGEAAGMEDSYSPWEVLGRKVAGDLGLPFRATGAQKKKSMFSFLRRN